MRVSHALLAAVFSRHAPTSSTPPPARACWPACSPSTATTTRSGTPSCARRSSPTCCPGERARFHARYAEAYEAAAAAGTRRLAAEISYHWLGAHDAARAFPATIQAMREARAAAAYATAAQLGERALGLWDVVPDPEAAAGMGKLELMGRTASHLRNAGEGERGLALVKAALAECPRDDRSTPRLLRDKAIYLANVGRPGSIPVLEEALEVLGDAGPSELRMPPCSRRSRAGS